MKHLVKILCIGTALAAPLAHATPISANFGVSGALSYTYNSTAGTASVSFVAPDVFSTMATDGTNATVSPYFSISAPNNAINFTTTPFTIGPTGNTVTLGAAGVEVATAMDDGETLTFYATDYLTKFIDGNGAVVTGDGYFTETGAVNYTQTAATFSFSPSKTGTSSFGATTETTTIAATPEPSSLVLLGSGLVSAAGIVLRRRRSA